MLSIISGTGLTNLPNPEITWREVARVLENIDPVSPRNELPGNDI